MPKRKSQPDPHAEIARAVNRATDSEPVRGEDLLPPELQAAYLDAKNGAARRKPIRAAAKN